METSSEKFRPNAAALIRKGDQILAFERRDVSDAWQCPQGGIEVGEAPHEAVWREIKEETGLGRSDVELVAEYPGWLSYTYPSDLIQKRFGNLGQTQKWFLFDFIGNETNIVLDEAEFQSWRWMTFGALMTKVPDFKRPVFEQLQPWLHTHHTQ